MGSSANGGQVQFTPVNTGDLSEIPPNLPAGGWEATCSVKKGATKNGGFPMLILDWKTDAALEDENEDFVGKSSSDFLVFFPSSHNGSRMSKIKLKTMCTALGIEVPSVTALKTWDDIADFVAELDGMKGTIYTTVKARTDTGEQTTNIQYNRPGAALATKKASDDDEDDDEEEEAPAPKKKAATSTKSKSKR